MGFYLKFDDETLEEAMASHYHSAGYESIQLAVKDAINNAPYSKCGYQVVDSDGVVVYTGETP